MPSIVTNELRLYNAEQFVESLGETANSKIYMFIGRPQSWTTDSSPPTPNTIMTADYEYWDDMIAMRRINSSDVSLVVPRYNWTSGNVYTQFNNESNILSTQFFVVTTENRIYKCINNNNSGSSTVKPTGTSTNIIDTADGYKWKYMYELTDTELLKFYTNSFIAVHTDSTVSAAAIDGGIHNVIVLNGGSNYSNTANLIVTVTGDGSSANITANVNASNVIVGFNINNPGTNYRFANITISGGGGSGANAKAIISPRGGHGYDPSSELGSYYTMINGRLNFALGSGDFPVVNDYRRIGLIKDPKVRSSNTVAEVLTMNTTYGIQLTGVTGLFTIDEFITGGTSKANAYVVSANVAGSNTYIRYIQQNGFTSNSTIFSVGEIVTGQGSSATGNVSSVHYPEAIHDSGKVLYVNNRTPIVRRFDQSESIHLVIEF